MQIFSLAVAPEGDWEHELQAGPGYGGQQVQLEGYIGADWFHESHPLAKVVHNGATNTTTVQLADSSHYGVCESLAGLGPNCSGGDKGGAPGRFRVHGLLSNVDSAGEYFFDTAARILYVVPPPTVQGALGFWSGPALISVVNSTFVTVRDITVTGTSDTSSLAIVGGANNTIGGCTVRSCATGIVVNGGHENMVVGNDVFDTTGFHISTSSNPNEELDNSQSELVPTNNIIINNQFTQVWLSTTSWSVHAGGVGDRFSHNLLHDAPGINRDIHMNPTCTQ